MKQLLMICFSVLCLANIGCQGEPAKKEAQGKSENSNSNLITDQIVEASCGACKFAMPGDGCDLAIRIGDKAYYVDGSKLDDHGDAHADDGLCNCIRKAKVSGEIKEGRFIATSFEVLPQEKTAIAIKASEDKSPNDK